MKNLLKISFLFILFTNLLFANENYMYKDLEYLNLTEIQKEQVKEILLSQRKEFTKYYRKKAKAQKELKELMQRRNFNEERYENILEDIYEDAIEIEAEIFDELHKIFTPEQREKFSQRLEEWRVE